ncbi:MAG: hypothetical protein EXS03_06010 [Phycisphaerales bacterium]|nr:hypothetical protein [Phycisphaerales bacterium]
MNCNSKNGRFPVRTAALVVTATLSGIGVPLGAHHPRACADDGPPPCPDIERMCGDYSPPPGGGEEPMCICGPGQWVRRDSLTVTLPTEPLDQSHHKRLANCTFDIDQNAYASATSAGAAFGISGKSSWWDAGTSTTTVSAAFSSGWKETWEGSFPACPRYVMLAACGRGAVTAAAACAARPGCTASSSASVSGFAASRGNANAEITVPTISANTSYTESSRDFMISGNIGTVIPFEAPSLTGSYNSASSWVAKGTGSATGALAFTVKPDRSYCALTNIPIHTRWTGSANAVGAVSVDSNGSASGSGCATLFLSIR